MKINRYIKFGFPFLILLSCNSKNTISTNKNEYFNDAANNGIDSSQLVAIQDAKNDFKNKTAKYYFSTISIAPKNFVEHCKHYDIEVVTKGCIISQYEEFYNKTIDSLFSDKYRISIKSLFKK